MSALALHLAWRPPRPTHERAPRPTHELRGLARGGTSGAAHHAATVRLGAEVRLNFLTFAW